MSRHVSGEVPHLRVAKQEDEVRISFYLLLRLKSSLNAQLSDSSNQCSYLLFRSVTIIIPNADPHRTILKSIEPRLTIAQEDRTTRYISSHEAREVVRVVALNKNERVFVQESLLCFGPKLFVHKKVGYQGATLV